MSLLARLDCPWRAYVVIQSLALASVRVGVRVSTVFKFSKVCIVFLTV